MSKPVNMNQARKARDRMRKRQQADENAVKYGRTKLERELEAAQREKDARRLDQLKRDAE